jgi:uncharacterized membrane protein (DUF2068 family)
MRCSTVYLGSLHPNGCSTVGVNPTRKRPRRVTLFSLLVLLLGSGLNLARAVWAWRQAHALIDLSLSTSLPMTWLSVTSLAWAVVFAVSSLGLWRLRSWGRISTLVAVTLFHVHIWFNHIVFDRSDYARQVWPFAILHTVVVLVVVWGFLNWPSIRRVYQEHDGLAETGEDQ